jgi:hypothetical protein
MKILIPWIAIFLVGLAVSWFGMYLKRGEKTRRQVRANRQQFFGGQSARSEMQPPVQETRSGGIDSMQQRVH